MTNTFQPNWVSPPGDTILDLLEEYGWTQKEFATRMSYNKKHVNQLVNGQAPISEDTALRLEKVLGSTAGFWLRREAHFREALAKQSNRETLAEHKDWLKELPLSQIIKFNWVEKYSHPGDQVQACLEYFGVRSPDVWRKHYREPLAAFRASKTFSKNIAATTAWLRYGERSAAQIVCEDFDKNAFKETLFEIRKLTNESDPRIFLPRLKELCANAGVAFVLERTPNGCPVSGATKWISPHKALIMLSLRHKTNDHLWFSFFHEAGHLLLHGKKMLFLEAKGLDSTAEEEADKFASDFLIPRKYIEELHALKHTYEAVKAFAKKLNIPPAIVVGRLQHDHVLSYKNLNKVKVRYSWADEK